MIKINGFLRFSDLQTVSVYNTSNEIANLEKDWVNYVSNNKSFCKDATCPFVLGNSFNYDLDNFLYYRARAITADVVNFNGDLFPDGEIKKAYNTFVGKGIYFNHDSETPDKAFGIILDAAYSPSMLGDTCDDKYVELLGAIHRSAIKEKRPGLLEDIETGKVTATSMGTTARKAKCSLCGNVAVDTGSLCVHCNPLSPLYSKGRNIYGKLCYETNYDLSFIEDSIVYVPADPTAYMLEIYASKNNKNNKYSIELSNLFSRYSNKKITIKSNIKNVKNNKNNIKSNIKLGGIKMTDKNIDFNKTDDYEKSIVDITNNIPSSTEKILDNKIRRIIEEELRKVLAPSLDILDKNIRPVIKEKVVEEAAKAKDEVENLINNPTNVEKPDVDIEAPDKAIDTENEKSIKSNKQSIIFIESFDKWSDESKQKLIQAIKENKKWSFDGYLEA